MPSPRELALEVLSVLHERTPERLDTLVSQDFIDHGAPPWVPRGREGYRATLLFLHDVMRLRYEVHDLIEEGDRVAIRATAHGRHTTDHLGFPATGKPYAMPTMHVYRAHRGILVEHWGVRDELSVLWQVGALQAPAPPADLIVALQQAVQ